MPDAATFRTGRCRPHTARAAAIIASRLTGDIQAHDRAANGVPETNVDLIFKIGAMLGLGLSRSSATPATEDAGENIFEAAASALPLARLKVRKIKTAEIERRPLAAATRVAAGNIAKTACSETAAARISLSRGRIDVV